MLGACHLCRRGVEENIPVGIHCICAPENTPANRVVANNFENPIDHLCATHEQAYWYTIHADAITEMNRRLHIYRYWPRKKKVGHGWTHKKQHGPQPVKTPEERSQAVRRKAPGQLGHAQPRCFCGEDIGAAGHDRRLTQADLNAGRTEPETMRVRNCLGCND